MLYKSGSRDIKDLEIWIDNIGYRSVRESDIVQRLKKVRFLGTMPFITELKYNYSRYDHSLYVAKLADAIGRQLNASEDCRKMLVLMALLHDIGHLPFSHASEVFFRQTWGKYHTGHGSRLSYHLVKFLRLNADNDLANKIELASDLLQGRGYSSDFSEEALTYHVFHGPLSADTIDGITRASESIGLNYIEPSKIISGMIWQNGMLHMAGDSINYIYKFFRLKKEVYTGYVYSAKGMAAEAMLTRALELTFEEKTDKNDFILLDDDNTVEKIKYNNKAHEIFKKLENRSLYYSLQVCEPEKHKLISALFEELCGKGINPILAKRNLEKILLKQLNATSDQFILHTSIKLHFWRHTLLQQDLFSSSVSLAHLTGNFDIKKSFGQNVDAFFSEDLLSTIKRLRIPSGIKITNGKRQGNSTSAIEQHAGAYMTPEKVAKFIADWAIQDDSCKIIDPASGEGIFIKEAHKKFMQLGVNPQKALKNILGIEFDKTRWQESFLGWEGNVKPSQNQILYKNFFNYLDNIKKRNNSLLVDAIIGNPPYINYHRFSGRDRELALKLVKDIFDIKLSQRTSSWAPYLLLAVSLLKQTGKLGLLLPLELLTTDYAEEIRDFLRRRFQSRIFIFFKTPIFPGLQQDVLLLLASNLPPYGDRKIEVDSYHALSKKIISSASELVADFEWNQHKWTRLLVSNQKLLSLLDELYKNKKLIQFNNIANISLGQVTGDNSFFILSEEEIEKYKISSKYTVPIISKANHISMAIFNGTDFKEIRRNNEKCFLLNIPSGTDINDDKPLQDYLDLGKRKSADQKYKCRTRWPWYSVPMQKIPDAFLTYMSGSQVRLVKNSGNVYSTNTIHNINLKSNLNDADLLNAYITSFYSSITKLSIELVGRAYGGGVLKLEIGEARKILMPNLNDVPLQILTELSKLLKEVDKDLRNSRSDSLTAIDDIVICQILNLSKRKQDQIKKEVEYLKKRRLL